MILFPGTSTELGLNAARQLVEKGAGVIAVTIGINPLRYRVHFVSAINNFPLTVTFVANLEG